MVASLGLRLLAEGASDSEVPWATYTRTLSVTNQVHSALVYIAHGTSESEANGRRAQFHYHTVITYYRVYSFSPRQ